jgi:short-subunit dehydrogenase
VGYQNFSQALEFVVATETVITRMLCKSVYDKQYEVQKEVNEAISFLEKGKRLSRYNSGITLVIDLAREFIEEVENAADYDDNDAFEAVSADAIDNAFGVNVRGTLLMAREFIKRLGEYGGIIYLSTDSVQIFAGQIAYVASKSAIEALTRSIAMEVGKYGITVNCVEPGPTQTGWIDEDLEKAVKSQIPLGKLLQPQDIADAIVFLASDRAETVTGQGIKVSGGHAL